MKKNKILILFLISAALLSSGYKLLDDPDDFEFIKNMEIFYNVVNNLRNYYVDDIDSRKIITEAINNTLEDLDPYTVYIPESQIESIRLSTEASYIGIGITIARINGRFYISEILKNSSAEKSGLKVGDEIITVSGHKINNLSYDDFHDLMAGENGSELGMQIKRNGKIINISAQRQKQDIGVVTLHDKIDDIGYIKLEMFSNNSAKEFKKTLLDLKKENIKGLIIDLRDNPGGLLDQAVKIVNLFIPKGKVVVTANGKQDVMNDIFMTQNKPIDTKIPIVILINRNSASASEIVSGSLQDYDRAVLIGETSFGKGLVQRIYDAGYNSKIKITVAKYYIPSGRCIQAIDYKNHKTNTDTITKFYTANGRIVYQGRGITPDILLNDNLPKAIKTLQDSMYIFLFCNQYFKQLDTNTFKSVDKIKFSDFDSFLKFLDTSGFYENLRAIKQIDSLENFNNPNISNQISKLKETYQIEIKNQINTYKDQIIIMIEKEIANRIFHHEGLIKFSLYHDKEIKKAIEILNNQEKYKKILQVASN